MGLLPEIDYDECMKYYNMKLADFAIGRCLHVGAKRILNFRLKHGLEAWRDYCLLDGKPYRRLQEVDDVLGLPRYSTRDKVRAKARKLGIMYEEVRTNNITQYLEERKNYEIS
ncbi:hypothetical protein [Lapidilactobacillus gannanensis]|uniref:Uncharacterized protein n=1 Tax=Lapidilactobacillus gannanensis TaxID=2486002 RepID=A0ABW4BMB7_9LACO|nr:hypothetical protein [Lapidilactobacillus gannanensis]